MSSPRLLGLHHVTAICGDPQANVDFYCGVLGLRLVKRTVNFDDPQSYHLYYGDVTGSPGTIMTFFAWPVALRVIAGTGQVNATAFAVPPGSAGFWRERLAAAKITLEPAQTRFGREVISFTDPDGMRLELIATPDIPHASAWAQSPVPAEHAIRGFHSVTAAVEGYERTARLLTGELGFQQVGEADGHYRFAVGEPSAAGRFLDLLCTPAGRRGQGAAGSVHHIAWRAADDEVQKQWRERLAGLGFNVSPVMDRNYFHSIYFREPGGVLFEIATDNPGFAVDEPAAELGQNLKLPPQFEPYREQLAALLPPLRLPNSEPTP